MKAFKIKITGDNENFNIEYNFTTNFVDYKSCDYEGTEQEKYQKFYDDLKVNGASAPLNIKVKMTTQTTDRALMKNDVLKLTDVNEFIKRLSR